MFKIDKLREVLYSKKNLNNIKASKPRNMKMQNKENIIQLKKLYSLTFLWTKLI